MPAAAENGRKWSKIVHFLFARTGQRDDIYQLTVLWIVDSACLAVSKALI